jgi:hypothetical protein
MQRRYDWRDVVIYWHVERKSMAIHSQVISCSASEVAAMIEGAMRHGTSMEVDGNYVDSHGQSEIGFGLTRLLGFDLLPRIKRINHVKLYRPAAGEPDACPRLAAALTRPIRWDVIAEQYDQMVQLRDSDPLGHRLHRGDPAPLRQGQRDPPDLPGDDRDRPRRRDLQREINEGLSVVLEPRQAAAHCQARTAHTQGQRQNGACERPIRCCGGTDRRLRRRLR